jgi:hypothetical protein
MIVEEWQPGTKLGALEREWKRRSARQGARTTIRQALEFIRDRMSDCRLFVSLERGSVVAAVSCHLVDDILMIPWLSVLRALSSAPVGPDLLGQAMALVERDSTVRVAYSDAASTRLQLGWDPCSDILAAADFSAWDGLLMTMQVRAFETPALGPGYRLVGWEDRYLDEAARVMAENPDPFMEIIGATVGFCRQELLRERSGQQPLYPPDLGTVLLHGERVCGFITCRENGIFTNLYLDSGHRDRHLGLLLATTTLNALHRRGVQETSFFVDADSYTVPKLYAKLGFRPAARTQTWFRHRKKTLDRHHRE